MNLNELRTEVRRRSDMENTEFVTDDELQSYINQSYGDLYDKLVETFEDYYSTVLTFSLGTGVSTYALPADFYKLRGIDFQVNGPDDWFTVRKFNFAERNSRNRVESRLSYGRKQLSYRIMGTNLIFYPESEAQGTYRMWYVPRYVPLALGTDEMDNVLDFDDYVIVDSAIKCLAKEESDITALKLELQGIEARIRTMARDRDAGEPDRVADVSLQAEYQEGIFPRF